MKENNIVKEKPHKLLLNIPLGIPAMDILPFQGVNWNNRKLAQGVAVGLEYIVHSVRSKCLETIYIQGLEYIIHSMRSKWLKTIYIQAQSQRVGKQNGLGNKTKIYKKRPEWAK